MPTDAQVDQWILSSVIFSLTRDVRRKVRIAMEFFEQQLALPVREWDSRLKAIDFSRDVRVELLWLHDELMRYGYRGSEFGGDSRFGFFTKPGTSPRILGIDSSGRSCFRFRVRMQTWALFCRAQDFDWALCDPKKPVYVHGSGQQYIVPRPRLRLELLPEGDRRPFAGPTA